MSVSGTALAQERIERVRQNHSEELDLSGLGLSTLPPALDSLTGLKRLDISGNRLQELPAVVFALGRLEVLDVGNNRIVRIQPSIQQLAHLVVLDLSENRLSALPTQISDLTRIRALRLFSNRLSTLPANVFQLPSLLALDIAKNIISCLPTIDASFSNLKYLDLSCNSLQCIPDGLSRLTNLRQLDLSNNKIISVGSELIALQELEELHLDNNCLTHLPMDIPKLVNLRAISMDGNPSLQIPTSLLRRQASDSVNEHIRTDHPRGEYGFIEPTVVFGFFLAIGGIPGVLSLIDLYYKHFRQGCSVKLIYPNGTEVHMQNLSRKKAMKIAQQHEKFLDEGRVLIDLGATAKAFEVEAKRNFAVGAISRVRGVELLPKEPGALPVLFQRTVGSANQERKPTKVSILFVAADPSDATRLRLGEESREIQEKLQLAKSRELFTFDQRWSVRPEDLTQALIDVQPKIVHFSGHGTSTGAICLEDDLGRIHLVEPDALAGLFELVADHVQCVVLNACYSEIQAKAIAIHIPYVIGMSQAIGDNAAIAFAVGFYQALGGGRSIEDAFNFGCVQIRLQGIPEHLTPVLVKKPSTTDSA